MPAIQCKDQFEAPIVAGEKGQTIRCIRADIAVGCELKFFVRWRRKDCRQFHSATCTSLRPIRRARRGEWYLYARWEKRGKTYWVEGPMRLGRPDLAALARADGFDSVEGFEDFFDRYAPDTLLEIIGWK